MREGCDSLTTALACHLKRMGNLSMVYIAASMCQIFFSKSTKEAINVGESVNPQQTTMIHSQAFCIITEQSPVLEGFMK
jgi:hypothetical protein